MLKRGGGILFREIWRRQTIVISMDRLGVPRVVQDTVPWIRQIRYEYEQELKTEEEQKKALEAQEAVQSDRADALVAPPGLASVYRKYICTYGDPLGCNEPYLTLQQQPTAKYCLQCDFPAILRDNSEIRGNRGTYRINSFTGRRGMGRLYRATQLSDSQPVVIKEYLLPNLYFNQEEANRRKQAFMGVAGLSLADGRFQDFRLETPWEAVSDRNEERCYLVTINDLDTAPTLRNYLIQRGAMTETQVLKVLNQVLQTLELLHCQKFRLPAGQVYQGLAHGNITLDTLLIKSVEMEEMHDTPLALTSFFIHMCDLALWESLFYPPLSSENLKPSPAQDLVALGYVSFYLLTGQNIDPLTGQPVNPRNDEQWPVINPALKNFILDLQQSDGPFKNAEEARITLLKIQLEKQVIAPVLVVQDEEESQVKNSRIPLFILGALGLAVLGVLIWSLIPKPQAGETAQDDFMRCCVKEISAVPSGGFTYTGASDSAWTDVLEQKNRVWENQTLENKLQEKFKKRQSKLDLEYKLEPSLEGAIDKVRSGTVNFAIASGVDTLTGDLKYKEVAYDGILVVVDFSYSRRENSLPAALKGKISFEQLRKLYTGKINNWKDLGGPPVPVKLYIPAEAEAVRIFERQVLKDEQQINEFRKLLRKEPQPTALVRTEVENEITPLETGKMLRKIRQGFEEKPSVGAIGFGTIRKIFGDCTVYPLALVEDENKQPVQALIQDNGEPVTPTTDLCNKKGSYLPNIQVLKTGSYPLGYPIAVVYLRDNSRPPIGEKFADMLRTREMQCIIGKTGLMPIQPLPKNCN